MPGPSDRLTIEELAARAGTSVRNIRSYQTRGLLEPPDLVKSSGPYVGYYDDRHVERLALIDRMRRRGFSLQAIHDVVGAWQKGQGLHEILGLEEALMQPEVPEVPENQRLITEAELTDLIPGSADKKILARLDELAVVRSTDGGYLVPNPSLLRIGQKIVQAGVPLEAMLEAVALLQRHASAAAADLTEMIKPHLVEPLLQAGLSEDRTAEILEVLRQLPRLAADALRVLFLDALRRKAALEG